jgi:peptidoglycan/xylan/chitin deacetylase (PgdA/CDA1 family)
MTIADIPILNYHKIEKKSDIGITSRHPQQLERDISFLYEQGYQTITFEQYAEGINLPERPVVLTFDDGYQSVYTEAFPVFKKYNFTAVIFMPTAFIGKTNDWDIQFSGQKYVHLNRTELKHLSAAGFEIASHGRTHRSFTAMSLSEVERELVQSKQELESLTGKRVQTVCYPFGCFNEQVLNRAEQAGYRFGLASLYFTRHKAVKRELALRRFNIYRQDSLNVLNRKITTDFFTFYGLRDWLFQLGGKLTPFYQKITNR